MTRLFRAATLLLLCAAPTLAAPPAAPAPRAAPAILAGEVQERGTRAPLAYATVTVSAADGSPLGAADADERGRFTITLDAAGAVKVLVAATDHVAAGFDETLAPGVRVDVIYHLERARYARYETTVKSARAREEVARTTLSTEEVQKIPGTHGDPLRAVTNLPGVARAPFDTGQLVLWGAAPGDSRVLVGGHSIPLAFHFGVGSAAYNGNLVDHVDYLPGSFGVRYGRAIGGILDITPRAGARDGFHGYASIDFIDAGALVEGPLGGGSFAVAARRSLVDAALSVAGKAGDLGFVLSPTYWDYQAMIDQPLWGGKLKVMAYGSDDQLSINVNGPDADPQLKGRFDTRIWFHALNLDYLRRWGGVEVEFTASGGPQHTDYGLGETVGYVLDVFEYDWRLEARYKINKHFRLIGGIDYNGDWYQVTVKAPYVAPEGQLQPPISVLKSKLSQESAWEFNPALYLEGRIDATDRLQIVPGLRADYFSGQRVTFDPRVSARLTVAPRTALLAAVGLYHQASPAPFADPVLGNPRLRPQEALHVSLGIESRPFAKLQSLYARLTGFYKQQRYLASTSDALVVRDGAVVPELYSDAGIGRVYGLELMIRQELSRYLWGWIAYTLSRSERQDHPGDPWRLFPYDQTHILTLVLSARLPWNLDAGVRFRYVTGNPDTPIRSGIYFADSDVYVGVPGALYSTRQPHFYQLDLRLDKRFVFDRWTLAVYVDVSNVTNHGNVDGYNYSFDKTRSVPVTGLPIFPSLGIKAAF